MTLEAIDLYYLHRVDPNVPVEDVFALLQVALLKGGAI